MQFLLRPPVPTAAVGLLPATFNPITIAHLELARAALTHVEQAILVLPRVLPHKDYSGAGFAPRLLILQEVVRQEPRLGLAVSEGGLFAEIAREFREAVGKTSPLWFVCGRDAAERIAGWNYGRPGAFAEMMRDFGLLVAGRDGDYLPPEAFASSIRTLALSESCADVSATLVREKIERGKAWEDLVPEAARKLVQRFYGQSSG